MREDFYPLGAAGIDRDAAAIAPFDVQVPIQIGGLQPALGPVAHGHRQGWQLAPAQHRFRKGKGEAMAVCFIGERDLPPLDTAVPRRRWFRDRSGLGGCAGRLRRGATTVFLSSTDPAAIAGFGGCRWSTAGARCPPRSASRPRVCCVSRVFTKAGISACSRILVRCCRRLGFAVVASVVMIALPGLGRSRPLPAPPVPLPRGFQPPAPSARSPA
jgi:hypothetical protein